MRRARNTDPATSWSAAGNNSPDKTIRGQVLEVLQKYGPLTHDQIVYEVKFRRPASESGVRTRVSELVEDGLVERVPDMVAKSRYGRASLLWRIAK